jgi:hypothetical protein
MEYDLKLSQQHVQTVLQALGELPLKFAVNVFAVINEQVARQDEERAVSIKDEQ